MADNLTVIDNKRGGDCGRYAYAYSFVYYLKRNQGNLSDYQGLFHLKQEDFKTLQAIIGDKAKKIEAKDLETIDAILIPKFKELTATATKEAFSRNPEGSDAHAALECKLRQNLKAMRLANAEKIKVANKGKANSYNTSEFSRIEKLKAPVDDYAKELAKKFENLELNGKNEENQQATINKFFTENTTQFFTQNDNQYLNTYIEHINTDGIWVGDEQLFALHETINNHLKQQEKEEIPLKIYHNHALVANLNQGDDAGIVLDNINNKHWRSLVPFEHPPKQQEKATNIYHTSSLKEIKDMVDQTFQAELKPNESEDLNQKIEAQLDTYLDKIKDNDELTNLHALAKEDLKDNDKQVACLFFQRYEGIKQDKERQASPSLEK